ncbi:MAG: PEP-CTERM sorting domain-containing protein [Cyanothece sp. SIO2G6]|nr:PEP-CTERM sorting domain-containing protein [Cyanothece sp. SIO2G6]
MLAGTSGFRSSGDIVFDPTQNLFWGTSTSNRLVTIGLDGSVNEIGNIGFSNVYGLFFNEGILYGHTAAGEQITLDVATGAGTFDKQITGNSGQIWGSASLPSTGGVSQSVPEPASVLGLLGLTAFGALSYRKR